jgi:MoxR-like ATPase
MRQFYSRKNLIIISISIIYAFFLMFVGLCTDANYSIMSKNNPIALLSKSFNQTQIKAGISGLSSLLVFALYVVLCTWALVSEYRYYAKVKKDTNSLKAWAFYLLTFVVSFGLATLISYGILAGVNETNFSEGMLFIGQAIGLSLFIFVIIGLFVGGVCGLIVNWAKVNKPFNFFSSDQKETLGNTSDNTKSSNNNANASNGSTDTEEDSDAAKAFGDAKVIATSSVSSNQSDNVTKTVTNLDDRDKVFPALSKLDEEYHGQAIGKIDSDNLSLSEIANGFRNYLAKDEKLYFSKNTIDAFIAGFATSRLEILEGLSGTGKSSLPRYFAKYLNAKAVFIPVQASWRDKTSILGYYNDFSKSYTETDFLTNLYEANYNPDQLTIFVLDEMNISRVEYYFADFLSVLEYPSDYWKIRLMQFPKDFIAPVNIADGEIKIPTNSYFVGTANKDDSTFSITSKVYDRALTIDFEKRNDPFTVSEETKTIHISASHLNSLFKEAKENKSNQLNDSDRSKFKTIIDYIDEEFDLAFGNRVLDQIDAFVPTFVSCSGTKEDALDLILETKLISKLQGRFEDYIKDGLFKLNDLLDSTYGKEKMPLSRKLISSLIKKL